MTENPNFYSDISIPEEERRDTAFQTVNAIRESVTLAKNSNLSITYEFAFGIIYDLDPELYKSIVTLLTSKNENELVRYYKDEAEVLSTELQIIEPVELIQKELIRVEELLTKKNGKFTYLNKKKFNLVAAKEYFTPRNQSEHKTLNHDFYLRSRYEYFGEPIYENDSFKDFKISKDKVLRLRLLHPDQEETILGVDLIYEHFDMKKNKVRFAHMQYKAWNNNVLYTSQAKNLAPQLKKMEKNLCSNGLCKGPKTKDRDYRFPYCSGFLRPTSKLQKSDSKLISTGLHLPICEAMNIIAEKGMIKKNDCKDKGIKGYIFEEMFNTNLVGSRWIDIEDLDKFYKSNNILSYTDRIRIHAQEIDTESDYEKNKNKD